MSEDAKLDIYSKEAVEDAKNFVDGAKGISAGCKLFDEIKEKWNSPYAMAFRKLAKESFKVGLVYTIEHIGEIKRIIKNGSKDVSVGFRGILKGDATSAMALGLSMAVVSYKMGDPIMAAAGAAIYVGGAVCKAASKMKEIADNQKNKKSPNDSETMNKINMYNNLVGVSR